MKNANKSGATLQPASDLGDLKLVKVNWTAGSCNYCTSGNPNKEDVYELQGHMVKTRLCLKCLTKLQILIKAFKLV